MFFTSLLVPLSLLLEVVRANICYYNVSVFVGTPGVSGSALGRLNGPAGVAATDAGDILVVDTNNFRIVNVSSSGKVSLFAGNGGKGYAKGPVPKTTNAFLGPRGVVWDSARSSAFASDQEAGYTSTSSLRYINGTHLFTIAIGPWTINNPAREFCPADKNSLGYGCRLFGYAEGQLNTAAFDAPRGLTLDASNNLYVADSTNHCIRSLSTRPSYDSAVSFQGGKCTQLGFANGAGTIARFNTPTDVTFGAGQFWIADTNNHCIRLMRLSLAADVYTVGGSGAAGFSDGVAALAGGIGPSPNGPGQFKFPTGVTFHNSAVYVADSGNKVCLRFHFGLFARLCCATLSASLAYLSLSLFRALPKLATPRPFE
jgi:hypothetical protein